VSPPFPTKHVEPGNLGIRRIVPWVAGVAAVGSAFAGGIWLAPQFTGGNQNSGTRLSTTATGMATPTASAAVLPPTTSKTTQSPPNAGSTAGVFGPFDSGDAKVFVDGKPREVRGKVTCSEISGDFYIGIDPPGNRVLVMLSRDLSRVLQVNLGTVNGTALPAFLDGAQRGDAAVVKEGNSYRITGNIATGYSPTDPTLPFEIDVTCP
jgi:lipoprotein LpqH